MIDQINPHETVAMRRMKSKTAFTLIELLVVISIIAILIAILLPTLSKAKRAAKVLHCMSNFKQLGIGLKVYTNENNHRYPPAPIGSFWHTPIYDIVGGDSGIPDGRENFLQIASGRPSDLLWCPLYFQKEPNYNGVDEWTRHYISCGGTSCYQVAGIVIYFLAPSNWNFANSGNPDSNGDGVPDRPTEPDEPEAAIMSDHNWWDPAQCTADGVETVCSSVHNSQPRPPGSVQRVSDTNILYGDGHVITRIRVQNWVVGGGSGANLTMY